MTTGLNLFLIAAGGLVLAVVLLFAIEILAAGGKIAGQGVERRAGGRGGAGSGGVEGGRGGSHGGDPWQRPAGGRRA